MANTSLPYHEDYPALPAQAYNIKPDTGCAACPKAQTADHLSCSTFHLRNDPAVADSALIDLTVLRKMQGQLHRRAFDVNGVVGGNDGSVFDAWYYYNAEKAINFTYASSWHVTNCTAGTGDDEGTCTLELSTIEPEDNAKQVLLGEWTDLDPVLHFYRVRGYYTVTCVQALDMLQFQYPSVGHMLNSKILQVTAVTDTTITVKIDKDLTTIWDEYYPIDDGVGGTLPDPDQPTVKIYHYGREAEQWFFIQEPHYFPGKRTQKTVETAELDEDGIWVLETAVIAPPDSQVDPLVPVFIMEGWNGTAYETINETTTRLHIKPTETAYALKTTKPAGSIVEDAITDLTGSYTRFRATYYAKVAMDDPDCVPVAYDRCFHSRIDYSNSVGNFGAAKGAGIATDGKHVYCSQFVYPEYEPVDDYNVAAKESVPPAAPDGIPDKVNVTLHHPTGLSSFPTDTGQCILYNYCNKWVNSVTKLGDKEAPFNRDYTMQFLVQLWFACDMRRHQRYVLAQGAGGYVVQRVGIPSIMWQHDYYNGVVTPAGFHEQDFPRGNGTWFVSKPEEREEGDGGTYLRPGGGLERALKLTWNETTETYESDPDYVGRIPRDLSGFKTRRDPFNPAATVDEDLLEYIGAQVERDSMQIVESRGLSQISMALSAEDILVPNVSVAVTTEQNNTRSVFQVDEEGNIFIHILPYRQDGKEEVAIGGRTVHSVVSLGSNRYRIIFTNETKTFSRFDLGTSEIGDSYDKIFTVQAGGGPVILPYEHQGLFSYEGDKNTGSRAAGVMPLDCMEVDGHRFVVALVGPHEGPPAATWGNRQVINAGVIGGFFEATVPDGEDGEPLTPITVTSVIRQGDSLAFSVTSEDTRLDAATETAWFDGNTRIYFAAADDGDIVDITFEDRDGTEHTASYTIVPSFSIDPTVGAATDYSEWTGATTKTVYIGAAVATVVEGGTSDPAAGSVRVNDNSGKIALTFNVDDAPNDWRMVLDFAVEADPPKDDWAAGGNYLAFGKNMDMVEVIADSNNGSTYLDTVSIVGMTATFYKLATVFLPKVDTQWQWMEYNVGAWADIPSEYVTTEAASGRATITAAWKATVGILEADPRKFCFKALQVQMIDNRGQVPASILTKTEAVLDGMAWVLDRPASGFGNFSISEAVFKSWGDGSLGWNGVECVVNDYESEVGHGTGGSGPPNNYLYIDSTEGSSQVVFRTSSTSFGAPQTLLDFPDGVVIEEAWGELNGGGLTREYTFARNAVFDCEGNVVDAGENPDLIPVTTVEDIAFSVLGFKADGSYEVVGSIPGATEGTAVVNITALVQAMYANRKIYRGYGAIFSPVGLGDGEGVGLEKFLAKPGIGIDYVCTSGFCYEAGETRPAFNTHRYLTLTWGSVSLGQVAIKVNYNGKDKLALVQPRLPSFKEIP